MYFFFFFSDVTRGSSLFENIFVSGGALLTDDVILKTIDIGNYSVVRSCDFHNWRKLTRKRQTAIHPESAFGRLFNRSQNALWPFTLGFILVMKIAGGFVAKSLGTVRSNFCKL